MLKLSIAVTASALLCFASASHAGTIRATSAFGPSHVLATDGYPTLFEKLETFTNGRWKGRDTPSGLLAPNEMNTGLRDGISDMGPIILPYFAADYPESSIVGELSMVGTDNRAISSAVTEYIATCAECQAEFARNGQVYLGSDATTTYAFLSRTPLRSLDDMRGVRIRTAGSVFTRLIQGLGGQPVAMPASELFEGLSQGVIDATYSSIPDLRNAGLYEVVRHVTVINQGVFNAAAMTNASQILWSRMDPEERAALARATQYAQSIGVMAWRSTEQEALARGRELGIEFIEPGADLLDAAVAFRTRHMETVVDTLGERGVRDASEKVTRYLALVEKWHELVDGVETAEDLAELRYREIWSGIDFKAYGQ